jgi:hypothetical protein
MAESKNPSNPYVGPIPFGTDHSDFFFGRDTEAKLLLARAIAERVVLFYAESGAGKTSLINTRLIPSLQKKYQVLPVVRVGRDLPYKGSYDEIYNIYSFNTLLGLIGDKVKPRELNARPLVSLVREKSLDIDWDKPHWLIIDQFEEIVTTHLEQRAKRADFFDQLRELLETDKLLSVVLAMREDYLADVYDYGPHMPGRLNVRFRMERLNKQAANDAVRLPAEKAGRVFPKEVAKTLVEDLSQLRIADKKDPISGDHVEPVHLQIVCYTLWAKLDVAERTGEETSTITPEHLKKYAQVDQVLEDYYDIVIRDVAKDTGLTEADLRRWVGNTLITASGIRSQVERGYLKTGNLPNKVVDKFQSAHLVRVEEARGGKWYELSHDRFIPPILQSNARWSSQGDSPLALAAHSWIESNHDENYLIRGQILLKAQKKYLPQLQTLSQLEQDFLTASINTESSRTKKNYFRLALTMIAILAIFGSLSAYAFKKNSEYQSKNLAYEKEKEQFTKQKEITTALLKELGLTPALEHLEQVSGAPTPSPEGTPTPGTPEITVNNPVVGQLRWHSLPDGGVEFLDNWDALNIVTVDIPQLRTVRGANNGKVQFNRLAADQLKAAWAEIEAQGLLDRVLVWNGSFARKSVRGTLSSHALGLAFDINYDNNRSGFAPPYQDEAGSVRDLVPIFQKYGFTWGGSWNIPEGAHFQVVRIVKPVSAD